MDTLHEIATEILTEMYDKAEPPLDYQAVQENPGEFDEDWYLNHYLPQDTQQEILNNYLNQYDLTEKEQSEIRMFCTLYNGPTTKKP